MYTTESCMKTHLGYLTLIPCCCNLLNTSSKLWRCSSSVVPVIRISSYIANNMWNSCQYSIHDLLKNGRCRGISKWHTNILIQPLVGVDGGKRLRLLTEQHLLIGLGGIQLREPLSTCKGGKQLIRFWQRVLVYLKKGVDGDSVVATQVNLAITFRHRNNGFSLFTLADFL